MTAGDLSQPVPGCEKSLGLPSNGNSRAARERSLTELMSLADWRWFVPESVGLLVVISLARTALPLGHAGAGSLPHPFWIPVLLLSGQYGIMGGLFATLAASAALLLTGLPPQSATQDFYAYAGIVAAQPCAWFGTALVMGGLRTLHIHHQTELQERLDQTGQVANDLADGLERAITEIERLEHRIATDSSTLASFLHSLAQLELTDRRSLVASFADVIRYGVGATSFAIHLEGAHGLEPCLAVEHGTRVTPTTIIPPAPSVFREIHGEAALAEAAPAANDPSVAHMPHHEPVCPSGTAKPIGVVVCNCLLPTQDPAMAVRRLNEVCRVLAVLLAVCPGASAGACGDDGT